MFHQVYLNVLIYLCFSYHHGTEALYSNEFKQSLKKHHYEFKFENFVHIQQDDENVNARIINGDQTQPDHFKYTVSLKWPYDDQFKGLHYCGGSLIAKNVILTAAQCVPNSFIPIELAIKGRTRNVNGSERRITYAHVVHHNYEFVTGEFDFALLFFKEDSKIKPVELSERRYHKKVERKTVVVGWGSEFYFSEASDKLLKASAKIVPLDVCNSKQFYDGFLRDTMLCAFNYKAPKGPCSFDLGGPLLVREGQDLHQVGVVSWYAPDCYVDIYPGVYARVSNVLEWIRINVENPPNPDGSTPPPTEQGNTERHSNFRHMNGFAENEVVVVRYYSEETCSTTTQLFPYEILHHDNTCETYIYSESGIPVSGFSLQLNCDSESNTCVERYYEGSVGCFGFPSEEYVHNGCVEVEANLYSKAEKVSLSESEIVYSAGDASKCLAENVDDQTKFLIHGEECAVTPDDHLDAWGYGSAKFTCNGGVPYVELFADKGCRNFVGYGETPFYCANGDTVPLPVFGSLSVISCTIGATSSQNVGGKTMDSNSASHSVPMDDNGNRRLSPRSILHMRP